MSYITKDFYSKTFGGVDIPDGDFTRLADIASDLIYDVCNVKPSDSDTETDAFKKAVCYQTEMLHLQGGVDAIVGFSEAYQSSGSESLGDYSVGAGGVAGAIACSIGGIPVSSLAIGLLKRLGLMSRWAYAEHYRGKS